MRAVKAVAAVMMVGALLVVAGCAGTGSLDLGDLGDFDSGELPVTDSLPSNVSTNK